jgi:hypothetical protein
MKAPETLWTTQRIKEEYPNVPVQLGRTLYEGHIEDGARPFATVTIRGSHLRGLAFPWSMRLEYSWKAIAHALNHGTALLT